MGWEFFVSNTCSQCSAIIPSDRTFCDAHYEEAMFEYERDLNNYHIAYADYEMQLQHFYSLSASEQNAYHDAAEDEDLGIIAGFAGLATAGAFWFFFVPDLPLVLGIIATIFTGLVFYFLRNSIGRLIRAVGAGVLWSILCFVVFFAFLFILDLFFDFGLGVDAAAWLILSSIPIGLLIGFYQEFTGEHHSYGGPTAPSEPTQPSP